MKHNIVTKFALAVGIAALSVCSAKASEQGVYTKLDAGASFISGFDIAGFSAKFKTGFATNGAVGFNLNQNFALELEGGYAINELKSIGGVSISGVDATAWSGFGNAVLRGTLAEPLSAYLAAGPGFVRATLDGFGFSGSDTTFAGQAKTGLSYKIAERVSLDLSYRARFMQGFEVAPGVKSSSAVNHQITTGITIGF